MADKKRGLGRGFDSLIPMAIVEDEFDVTAKVDGGGKRVSGESVREVDPALVDPNPHQPRERFDQEALEALAASIRVHGILQPLVLTKAGDRYELIAGERRLRAAKIAGLETVPVIVRSFDEQQKLELALIENIQRAELNPMELATAYCKLRDQFNMTLEDIGNKVGRDRSTVANTQRLMNLPIEAKRAVADEVITEGHARVILSISEKRKQLEMLKLMINNHWTVRQAEEYARGFRGRAGNKTKAAARIAAVNQMTMDLGEVLRAKVTQVATAKGGKLIIEYGTQEDLDHICQMIKQARS